MSGQPVAADLVPLADRTRWMLVCRLLLVGVLFAIGICSLWKERWPVAVATLVPGLLALLASGLHKYPFAGRLLLFLVPLMILGVARGACLVGAALRGREPIAALVLLGVLLAAPCLETYQELHRPMRYEQIEPVLADVRGQWQPGDRIYVYYGAVPAFTFYTREAPFPSEALVIGTEARENEAEYRAQLVSLKGLPRVWLLFSHRHKHEETLITAYAEGLGRCLKIIRGAGAAAYLFDFTAGPDAAVPVHPVDGPHGVEKSPGVSRGGDR